MPLGVLFWVIYVVTLILGFWANYDAAQPLWWRRASGLFVLWVLVGILGWKVFGPVVN